MNDTEKVPIETLPLGRRVRIHDVARKCGLSITTVSQALNLRADQCRVSGETRAIVQRVANELGYRPSRMARGLAKGRSFTVGILAWSVAPSSIYAEMISVISHVLESHGYHLILASISDRIDQWSQTLLDEQVDGCVVLNNVTPELREVLGKMRLPAVLVNVESDLLVPQVLVDDTAGMRELTEHLLSLGHRRIAYFNGDSAELQLPRPLRHYALRDRENSFLQTMAAAGAAETAMVVEMPCQAFADQLAAAPPQERPTAVICFWHRLAMRLMRMLWEHGINVPADLSVAAFNDVEGVEDTIPPLTTVAIPNERMGHLAATMLLELIEADGAQPSGMTVGDSGEMCRRTYIAPRLVARASTSLPSQQATS